MRALLIVMAAAAVAHADPVVDVALDQKDVEVAFAPLVVQLDEPIGLAVIANNALLGLQKGDLVKSINGEVVLGSPTWNLRGSPSLLYLDVARGTKNFVVRVAIKRASADEHMDRDRYRDMLDMMRRFSSEAFKPVTKNGKPSGVTVRKLFGPVVEGDILRKIDGTAITTPDAAMAALDASVDHAEVVFECERLGKPFTAKIILDTPATLDPDLMTKIKKVDDTHYEIPKDVVDAVLANPMAVAKGARVVPAVKDGKAAGFKLYAIRPSSIYATLGLSNGDTITSVNGNELTTADKALEVYTKIHDAKKLVIVLERRGRPVTLTYTIK